MATQFTPGPWRAITGQGAHHRDWYIRCELGRDEPAGCCGRAVAKTCSSGIGTSGTVESNAHLIAAAPALYAACEAAYLALGTCPHKLTPEADPEQERRVAAYQQLREALAAARGEVQP